MRDLWRLEVLIYLQEGWPPAPDRGRWNPFILLAGITLGLELIGFLYLTGAFRPLSAL